MQVTHSQPTLNSPWRCPKKGCKGKATSSGQRKLHYEKHPSHRAPGSPGSCGADLSAVQRARKGRRTTLSLADLQTKTRRTRATVNGAAELRFCPSCGVKRGQGWAFCGGCGGRF